VAAIGKPCAYCGEPMAAPTRDHIRPRSKGGTLAPGNKAMACDCCNSDKGGPLACFVTVQAREGLAIRRAAIAGRSLASPPPSQTASWLRPRSRRRRNDVGGRIIIGNIRGGPLANDVGGEQTLNIGKAGQIAQKVAPSPGSTVSSVTSAHDVTR
jgi:HNH endonuclease